jgi:hypothetical protein
MVSFLRNEPPSLTPLHKISLRKDGGMLRRAYVVANLLLPRLQSDRSGLTQVFVELGCQIPKESCGSVFYHVISIGFVSPFPNQKALPLREVSQDFAFI